MIRGEALGKAVKLKLGIVLPSILIVISIEKQPKKRRLRMAIFSLPRFKCQRAEDRNERKRLISKRRDLLFVSVVERFFYLFYISLLFVFSRSSAADN